MQVTAVMTATRVLSLSNLAFLQTLNSTNLSNPEPDITPDMTDDCEDNLEQQHVMAAPIVTVLYVNVSANIILHAASNHIFPMTPGPSSAGHFC